MKNELIVGVITALLAGAALFSYNAQLNNNELAQFEEFKTTYGKIYTLEENVYRFAQPSSPINGDPPMTEIVIPWV